MRRCQFGDKCRNEHPGQVTAGNGGSSGGTGFAGFGSNQSGGAFGSSGPAFRQSALPNQPRNPPYNAEALQKDWTAGVEKPTWPLSSYGPAKNEPVYVTGLDMSPEEMRLKAYEARKLNQNTQYAAEETSLSQQANNVYADRLKNIQEAFNQMVAGGTFSISGPSGPLAPTASFGSGPLSVQAAPAFASSANPINIALSGFGTGTPVFGAGTSAFGAKPAVFGQTTPSAFVASAGTFGTSTFGQSPTTPAGFGQTSAPTAPAASAFGSTGFSSSNSKPPVSAFGVTGTPATGFSSFGVKPSVFGGGGSAFGQSAFGAQSTPQNAFGQAAQGVTPAFGQSAFVASAGNQPSAFSMQSQGQPSAFGAFTQPPAPEQPTPGFGQPLQNTPSNQPTTFGQASQPTSTFGQSNQNQPTSVFGRSAFGQTTAPSSAFGQPNQPASAFSKPTEVGLYSYGPVHPMKPHRIRMAHQLVSSYGMLEKMDVIRPARATGVQMSRFHTDEYIDFLNRVTPETVQEMTHGGTRFLVGEDNPAFEGLFEFCSISAGGSINAAERLNAGKTDIAVNWAGGLHHAKKRDASGFCYVNDINLAILELLRYHARVLYIDIDCHHGDGVEEAFYSTDRVLTCSFHKQKDYFPGTGRMEDIGKGKGKGYSVNVPLLNGVTDEEYQSIFEPVIRHVMEWYRPGAVVLQCGADSLANDKLGVFNLSMHGHANCVRFLRSYNIPLILLGGGGYTIKNVSCVWTYETACAVGMENEIDLNLPYSPYLEYYGPRYRLEVAANNMQNDNAAYLENIKIQILEGLRDLPFAPSVGLHQVPGTDLAEETGIRVRQEDEDSDVSDLDVEIAPLLVPVERVRAAYNDFAEASSSGSDSDSPLQRRTLMSYFREAERPKRRYPMSDPEDNSDPDDDETEEDEPWKQGRRSSKVSRGRMEVADNDINDMDGLVFGGKSWLADPPTGPGDHTRNRQRRADGNARRWFFKKDVSFVATSQVDRSVALRQSGIELSNPEEGLEQEDENAEDLDDLDDGLDAASPV
ncbi:hypothetical protein FRB98_007826 [Tulasnella sp. 332]|nr:hypothetical protein FRB98_007826 [Tulasnella sp. 332]